jgi:hypothetical protein
LPVHKLLAAAARADPCLAEACLTRARAAARAQLGVRAPGAVEEGAAAPALVLVAPSDPPLPPPDGPKPRGRRKMFTKMCQARAQRPPRLLFLALVIRA